VLNGSGCLYGQHLTERIEEMEGRVERFEKKLDRILWGLVAAAITLGTSAVMLGLNLAYR